MFAPLLALFLFSLFAFVFILIFSRLLGEWKMSKKARESDSVKQAKEDSRIYNNDTLAGMEVKLARELDAFSKTRTSAKKPAKGPSRRRSKSFVRA